MWCVLRRIPPPIPVQRRWHFRFNTPPVPIGFRHQLSMPATVRIGQLVSGTEGPPFVGIVLTESCATKVSSVSRSWLSRRGSVWLDPAQAGAGDGPLRCMLFVVPSKLRHGIEFAASLRVARVATISLAPQYRHVMATATALLRNGFSTTTSSAIGSPVFGVRVKNWFGLFDPATLTCLLEPYQPFGCSPG